MILELRGANTHNKGAELMLRAVAVELGDDFDIAVDTYVASYRERSRLGLEQKLARYGLSPSRARAATRFVPRRVRGHLRSRYGIVLEGAVDGVLDASGFAYSDQFDLERSIAAAELAEWAAARGKPMILLPQAVGPFRDEARRQAFLRIVESSRAVFVREQASFEHAQASGCRMDRVRLSPDFTSLLGGVVPGDFSPRDDVVFLVPSMKLLTETSEDVRNAYVPFFATVTRLLRGFGMDVRVLVHERGDEPLAREIANAEDIPVVRYEDAQELKGVISTARALVGSRFHALVSALSQGVPAMAIGWSHKYEMLFEDYGCGRFVVPPAIGEETLEQHLRALLEGHERDELVAQLRERADGEKDRARAMWAEVRGLLRA